VRVGKGGEGAREDERETSHVTGMNVCVCVRAGGGRVSARCVVAREDTREMSHVAGMSACVWGKGKGGGARECETEMTQQTRMRGRGKTRERCCT